tara:strand:- start:229 stop:381 length:153 start_codon:yes stop_codon:yes gene_type:complete
MMDKSLKESIKSFLSNLGNKDYSNANKDLNKAIERKLQERINKAYKKDLF